MPRDKAYQPHPCCIAVLLTSSALLNFAWSSSLSDLRAAEHSGVKTRYARGTGAVADRRANSGGRFPFIERIRDIHAHAHTATKECCPWPPTFMALATYLVRSICTVPAVSAAAPPPRASALRQIIAHGPILVNR